MSASYERKFLCHQVVIFATLFIGYACYAYNRKSASAAMPTLIAQGLGKSQAGETETISCAVTRAPNRVTEPQV